MESGKKYKQASPEPVENFIVIDRLALLKGVVADGIEPHQGGSSSAWLVDWLGAEGADPRALLAFRPEREQELGETPIRGELRLSRGVTAVVQVARELAKSTTGLETLHMRHVLFELICSIPRQWFGQSMSLARLRRLKRDLAERNARIDENGDAWRARARAAGAAPEQAAESVSTLADAPALIDNLGRQAFAEVLGMRIRNVHPTLRKKGAPGDSAFILHLDGPWGSGKSSVLNFLKADLEASDPRWLVVEFNAWRNQNRRPAWLPLILQVRSAAPWRLSLWTPLVGLVWLWWRLRMDWLPYLVAVLLISLAGLLVLWAGPNAASGLANPGETVKTLGAIIAAIGSVLALARGFTLGSHRNAEIYLETKTEPFRRIIRYFGWLVSAIHRPVAVFVDDLDRCDSDYVIELLEGIQTSLRAAPVVYVVAGDRKWICSSFEKRYADFCQDIGSPGRPLGYLFLDKVFQLSTSLPQLSLQRQKDYWLQLLERTGASPQAQNEERKRIAVRAATGLAGKTRPEDIQREIDKTKPNSLERETWVAEAAKQTASKEAIRAAEHRLQRFYHLLEPNPRSMKRLVNAYGLNQARAFLEERRASAESLARWTIVELRWPLLADYLARNWPEISDGSLAPRDFPETVRALLADPEVRAVIGEGRDKGRLTVKSLKPILD